MNVARVRLPGHPDAVCDLVAEAIVDEYTRRDPTTRLRVSVMGGRGALFVAGDVMSKADFDVSQLITRTLGSLGVMDALEPFVSLEPVVAERATLFGSGIEAPVSVVGYATGENSEMLPSATLLARRVAKTIHELRSTNDKWFWLGGDAEVVVEGGRENVISLRVENGLKPLDEVRDEISSIVHTIDARAIVRVNELGSDDLRGIGKMMGASGRGNVPYGSALPSSASGVGFDVSSPEKSGAWLARAAARHLVKQGAKAAMIHVVYRPGERQPAKISARDERGKDLSKEISLERMSLDRVMDEWWRPSLCADAARWGYAGEAGLPWEG